MTNTPYIYRNPIAPEWVAGHFNHDSEHVRIPLHSMPMLVDLNPDEPVDIERHTIQLTRHRVHRVTLSGGHERWDVYAEDERTALAWADGRLDELASDAYCGSGSLGQTAPPLLLDQADPMPPPIDWFNQSNHQAYHGPAPETDDDVVELSAAAVDDHVYHEHSLPRPEKKKQSWDEWMASSAQVLADAGQ